MSPLPKNLPWMRWCGEFVVIAVGVALGFQVDRWYEQRQEARIAGQYIERLREDLTKDIEYFQGGSASASRRLASLERVVQSVSSDAVVVEDPTRYLFDLRQANMRFVPIPNDGTYEELLSTGNMALLPLDLRRQLRDYYSQIESFSQFYGSYESMQMEAYRRFAGILPPENFGVLSRVIEDPGVRYSDQQALDAAARLRDKQAAIDWLYQMGELKVQERSLSERYQNSARELLNTVEQL